MGWWTVCKHSADPLRAKYDWQIDMEDLRTSDEAVYCYIEQEGFATMEEHARFHADEFNWKRDSSEVVAMFDLTVTNQHDDGPCYRFYSDGTYTKH